MAHRVIRTRQRYPVAVYFGARLSAFDQAQIDAGGSDMTIALRTLSIGSQPVDHVGQPSIVTVQIDGARAATRQQLRQLVFHLFALGRHLAKTSTISLSG